MDNLHNKITNTDNNFFINEENPNTSSFRQSVSAKRLNDYDYNILKDEAYKDISDDIFKLEYKISQMEEDLKTLDIQIKTAQEINDFVTIQKLTEKKNILIYDLSKIKNDYHDKSVSTKLSSGISDVISNNNLGNLFKIKPILNKFINFTLSKIPTKLSNFLEFKQSLDTLKNISKNVDDLMTMQIPYGEADLKYQQLSKYIVKANIIQSEISKHLR